MEQAEQKAEQTVGSGVGEVVSTVSECPRCWIMQNKTSKQEIINEN